MKNIFLSVLCCFAINCLHAQTYCLTFVKTELSAPLRVKYDWTLTASVAVDASVAINGTGSLVGQFDVIGGSGTTMSGSFTFERASSDPYDITPDDALPFGVTAQSNGAVATVNCAALPVELVNFKATPLSNSVKIEWQTASERLLNRYDIERSENGKTFEKIGTFKASNQANYAFMDEKPRLGINYYRLKMIDNDGVFAYSAIKTASIQTDKTQVKVFPNPTADIAYLNVSTPNESVSMLKLYNANGQIVRSLSPKLSRGDNQIAVEMVSLTSGLYFVVLEVGDKRFSLKISKN